MARPGTSLGAPTQQSWISLTLDTSWEGENAWPPLLPASAAFAASKVEGFHHNPSEESSTLLSMPTFIFFALLLFFLGYVVFLHWSIVRLKAAEETASKNLTEEKRSSAGREQLLEQLRASGSEDEPRASGSSDTSLSTRTGKKLKELQSELGATKEELAKTKEQLQAEREKGRLLDVEKERTRQLTDELAAAKTALAEATGSSQAAAAASSKEGAGAAPAADEAPTEKSEQEAGEEKEALETKEAADAEAQPSSSATAAEDKAAVAEDEVAPPAAAEAAPEAEAGQPAEG